VMYLLSAFGSSSMHTRWMKHCIRNSLHVTDMTQAHPTSADQAPAFVAFCIVTLNCNGVWSHRQRKDATKVMCISLAHENKLPYAFVRCNHLSHGDYKCIHRLLVSMQEHMKAPCYNT